MKTAADSVYTLDFSTALTGASGYVSVEPKDLNTNSGYGAPIATALVSGQSSPYSLSFAGTGDTVAVKFVLPAISAPVGSIGTISTVVVRRIHWVEREVLVTVCEDKDDYRFGYNGQNKDNEIAGIGNSIDYKERMYDTRLGRFRSIDPLTEEFPYYSPYQFAGNTPVQAIDLDGSEEYHYTMLMNKQGKAELKLISIKTANKHSWLGGLIEFDTKIEAKRYKVDYNGKRYHIGYPQYGAGYANAWKGEDFENNYLKKVGDAIDFEINYVDDNASQASSDAALVINAQNFGAETAVPFSPVMYPKNILRTALRRQGLKFTPNGIKEKWSEGGYDFEVRIHPADPNAPEGSNSASGPTYRVARRARGLDKSGQGSGWEYGTSNGTWYKQSELKSGKNPKAANDTHIPIKSKKK